MRVTAQILSMTLLAGLAAAQTAPASQTVQPNPQQPQANAKPTTSTAAKSPFAPKAKLKQATPQPKTPRPKTKTPGTAKANTQVGGKPTAQASAPKSNVTSAAGSPSAKTPVSPKPGAQTSAAKAKGTPNAPAAASTKIAAKPVSQPSALKGKTSAPAQAAAAKSKQPAPASATQATKNAPKPAEAKNAPVQAKTAPKPETSAPAPEKKTQPAAVAQSEPVNKLPNPGKRDPFLSPLAAAAARGVAANCTSGKRCLVVDQIVLKGIVQMKDGNMALVENGAKRPYVLHESDSLFNGVVVKITGDTMILREDSSDVLGRPVSKEVIKKVSAPSV